MERKLKLYLVTFLLAGWFSVGNCQSWPLSAYEKQIYDGLGKLELNFTSGNEEAEAHFNLGFKALLCFWYDFAEEHFQMAQQKDSSYGMAYVGEAMCQKQFLWNSEKPTAAIAILDKIKSNNIIISGKAAYWEQAARALFDEGSGVTLKDRNLGFVNKMEEMVMAYPEDDLAGSYYALGLLETAGTNQVILGATRGVLKAVLDRNPDFPAALHYVLHAYDFSGKGIAEMGLPYADRYPVLVTYASHGDHMPAHIFIQLGMWKECVEADTLALDASVDYANKAKNGSVTYDKWNRYHSLEYLQYYHLQLGRFEEANKYLEDMRKTVEKVPEKFYTQTWYRMAARQYLETRRYQIPKYLAMEFTPPDYTELTVDPFWSSYTECGFLMAMALQEMDNGKDYTVAVNKTLARLDHFQELAKTNSWVFVGGVLETLEYQLLAEVAFKEGNTEEAFAKLEAAATIEMNAVKSGSDPTLLFIPSTEWYGAMIVRAKDKDKASVAVNMFKHTLQTERNRTGAVYGMAQAYSLAGDEEKSQEWYAKTHTNWADTDSTFEAYETAKTQWQEWEADQRQGISGADTGSKIEATILLCLAIINIVILI